MLSDSVALLYRVGASILSTLGMPELIAMVSQSLLYVTDLFKIMSASVYFCRVIESG